MITSDICLVQVKGEHTSHLTQGTTHGLLRQVSTLPHPERAGCFYLLFSVRPAMNGGVAYRHKILLILYIVSFKQRYLDFVSHFLASFEEFQQTIPAHYIPAVRSTVARFQAKHVITDTHHFPLSESIQCPGVEGDFDPPVVLWLIYGC